MTDILWQHVKEVFDEARGLPKSELPDFLDERCENDQALREEVEKLLASYDSDFLEENPLQTAKALSGPVLTHGQIIGRYRINELIGSGGMGQVFLADDTELDRQVAFKILHGRVANDDERVRRFIQEARAASALNHPNILTIHEIGSFEDSRFIVSEYVNGCTLREQMRAGLSVSESVSIACQMATALKAAHAAGIVHRDIKPENVMIRQDGLVKVLDFGLAKLTEADDLPIDTSFGVASRIETSPGLVMGTAAYMSPEQARGRPVDNRTDLWSLGVVLHEMLTGQTPFKDEAVTELIAAIVADEDTPVEVADVPAGMRSICQRALAKNRDSRYQSAHDLLTDLEGEKKRMEYAIDSKKYVTVSSSDERKTQVIGPRRTLSAEYIVTSVKRHRYLVLMASLAVTIGLGFSVYKISPQPNIEFEPAALAIDASTTAEDLKMSRFPSPGKIAQVAISPDGKYVAYITSDGSGKRGLRLRELESSADFEVVPAPTVGDFYDLSFSPDANQIYYRHAFPPFTENTINRVDRSGGRITKLAVDVESGASLSPDSKMLAFNREVDRRTGQGGGDAVIITSPDGSNERVLSYSGFDAPSWLMCGAVPAWSPDSKFLACHTVFHTPNGNYYRLTTLNVADGSTKMRDEKWAWISGIVYLSEESLLIVGKPLTEEQSAAAQIWIIQPNAEPKSITSDVTGFTRLSATKTGDVLVTIQDRSLWDLWKMGVGDPQSATQITNSGDVDHGGINWTPDGRILFSSNISGNRDIWIMNADGSGRKQLTRNHNINMSPNMSPDGRYIVFSSSAHEWDWHIFRMDSDGRNLKQLTNGRSESFPRISPDGKWVYFSRQPEAGGPSYLCKMPIDGGEPVVLSSVEGTTVIHGISINGNVAYEERQRGDDTGPRRVKVMSPSDKVISKPMQFDLPTVRGLMQWSADGQYLTFLERKKNSNFDVIGGMSVDGKRLTKPLVTFSHPIINGSFAWSKDGKQIAYARGNNTSDAIMITKRKD